MIKMKKQTKGFGKNSRSAETRNNPTLTFLQESDPDWEQASLLKKNLFADKFNAFPIRLDFDDGCHVVGCGYAQVPKNLSDNIQVAANWIVTKDSDFEKNHLKDGTYYLPRHVATKLAKKLKSIFDKADCIISSG